MGTLQIQAAHHTALNAEWARLGVGARLTRYQGQKSHGTGRGGKTRGILPSFEMYSTCSGCFRLFRVIPSREVMTSLLLHCTSREVALR